jgi:hypothetical protein
MCDLSRYRAEFWAHKKAEADRLARLEKWETLFGIKVFPNILGRAR